jgi:hypothetical protein
VTSLRVENEVRERTALDTVRGECGLSVEQLWVRYVEIGGTNGCAMLEAYLEGFLEPSPSEHDLIAHALNERMWELGQNPVVRYVCESGIASSSGSGAPGATRAPTVSVVIPTLNEAKNIPTVLAGLPPSIDEVIVVDGHSIDDTVAVAKTCRPDVKIVLQAGRGKGNAIACGLRAVTSEITVLLDADGSTDPAEITRFVTALVDGSDVAKGSRFLDGGGSADMTFLRRLGNGILTRLVNVLWGASYTDLCYGYNAFWTRCATILRPDCNGFEVETFMNIRMAVAGLKVAEVASFEAKRGFGTSNLTIVRDGLRVFRTIIAEFIRPR